MDKRIIKIVTIISGAILVVGVIFTLLTAYYGNDIETNAGLQDRLLNPFFTLTLVTLIVAGLAAILFPFFMLLKSPKKLLGILAVIVGIVILGLISYALSGNAISPERLQKLNTTVQVSKWVGAGLIFTYFVMGFTFAALIFGSFFNMFRK
jgi:uncharacterized membrane protein YdbT with pleckstrin-like domain